LCNIARDSTPKLLTERRGGTQAIPSGTAGVAEIPQPTRGRRPQVRSLVDLQKIKQFSTALTDNQGFVYIPDNRFPSGRRFIRNKAGNKIKAE